jgi:hypothetical protein
MTCSNHNMLKNSEFKEGLSNWTGSHIRIVQNPVTPKDFSVLMGDKKTFQDKKLISILKQTVAGPFETKCAYYLHFRLGHAVLAQHQTRLLATVSYLDYKKNMIRSTPLLVVPQKKMKSRWFKFMVIVPPVPKYTRFLSVSFLLQKGILYVDQIQLVPHVVTPDDPFKNTHQLLGNSSKNKKSAQWISTEGAILLVNNI